MTDCTDETINNVFPLVAPNHTYEVVFEYLVPEQYLVAISGPNEANVRERLTAELGKFPGFSIVSVERVHKDNLLQ